MKTLGTDIKGEFLEGLETIMAVQIHFMCSVMLRRLLWLMCTHI